MARAGRRPAGLLVGWWGVVAWFPAHPGLPVGRVGVGVGLLFEIWIVDASIKFFCSCVECASPAWCARCLW